MKKIPLDNSGYYFSIDKYKNILSIWERRWTNPRATWSWVGSISGSKGKPALLDVIMLWTDKIWDSSIPKEYRYSTKYAPIMFKMWGEVL